MGTESPPTMHARYLAAVSSDCLEIITNIGLRGVTGDLAGWFCTGHIFR